MYTQRSTDPFFRSRAPARARSPPGLLPPEGGIEAEKFGKPQIGARFCTPEIAKVQFHWKMPLEIHGEFPIETQLKRSAAQKWVGENGYL